MTSPDRNFNGTWLEARQWLLPLTLLLFFVSFVLVFRLNVFVWRASLFPFITVPFLLTAFYYHLREMMKFVVVSFLFSLVFLALDLRLNGSDGLFIRNLYLGATLFFLVAMFTVYAVYERLRTRNNQQVKTQIEKAGESLEELKVSYKIVSTGNRHLEKDIEERASLYEETKRMGDTFDLRERMAIIKATMEKIFEFVTR